MDLLKLDKALSSGSSMVAIVAIMIPLLFMEFYVIFITFLYERVCSAIVYENLKSTIVKGMFGYVTIQLCSFRGYCNCYQDYCLNNCV